MKVFRSSSPFILVLAALLLCLGCSSSENGEPIESPQSSALTLSSCSADSICINLIGEDSVSVFDLLMRNHEVANRTSAMGMYVTGIDSMHNSRDAFWLFSVNDTMPQSSCDQVITRTGDKVTWHYRKME